MTTKEADEKSKHLSLSVTLSTCGEVMNDNIDLVTLLHLHLQNEVYVRSKR